MIIETLQLCYLRLSILGQNYVVIKTWTAWASTENTVINYIFLGGHTERAGDRGEEGWAGGHEEEEPHDPGQGAGADQDAQHEAGGAEGGAPD